MKAFSVLTLLIILVSINVSCNKSDSIQIERKQLFNSNWKFSLGDSTTYSTERFSDNNWRTLNLPHDWSIEGKSEINNPSGGDGGFFPNGIGWYRKSFFVPLHWDQQKISIYFEGVYMNAEVFINGKSLGIQPYGYTSFTFDLTPYLNFNTNNTIAVRVDNSKQKNSRWYSGSGIYRHVWLINTNPVHVKHWGVAITTPEVNKDEAIVHISTKVKNETDNIQHITFSTSIKNNEGGDLVTEEINIELQPNEEKAIIQSLVVSNPKLWSPENPNLYEVQLELKRDNKRIDVVNKTFGIRTIDFSAEKGFLLNGKETLLNGGCVHHDNGSLGAAAYNRAEERKVELLKEAGFNAVRTSHNPPSEAFLEACDRLGLLVIDEAFDGWKTKKTPHDYASIFDTWWKHDVTSMVLRDRNHPSVIMWSIGNEIIERTDPEAVNTAKMLANAVKSIDATRPVTSAMTTWNQGWEVFDPLMAVHDVAGYNYQLHHAVSDHERVSERIILQTESYPKDAFFCWNMAQEHPYVIGDFVWTAMDYLGESGIGRYYYPGEPDGEHWEANFYPWHGAYCGDIDLTGWRKPISHYRSMLYNNNEMLYMAVREPNPEQGEIKLTSWAVWPTWESWTWPEHTGKPIDVEVYSKYSKVRLYLNNTLIGEKQTTKVEEFKATFTLPYSSGILKAVGVVNGKEVDEVILQTADEAVGLRLTTDRKTIIADQQDLAYISVEIIDVKGVLNPNKNNKLEFNISGPGVIIGVDNASLKDTDSYVLNERKAWKGKALVVIKSTSEVGKISLEVTGSGLLNEVITIQSIKKK